MIILYHHKYGKRYKREREEENRVTREDVRTKRAEKDQRVIIEVQVGNAIDAIRGSATIQNGKKPN